MNQLKIEMKNCFGIKCLCHEFNCSGTKNVHLIYAPNGCMKTSFAKAMRYVSKQSKTRPWDLLHEGDNDYKGEIKVELDGTPVNSESVFVSDGDEFLDTSKTFANFLASSELKNRYDEIYSRLEEKKRNLMARLNTESRSSNCEDELTDAFRENESDTIFTILDRLATEITSPLQSYDFKYNNIFDDKGKVEEFVRDNIEQLTIYSDQYHSLIDNSSIFRSRDGKTFGTYQASQLEKTIDEGAFFVAEHKVILHGTEEPISTANDFREILQTEKERILNDDNLRKTYDRITAALVKNTELRAFKDTIEAHPEWIPELVDYDGFRRKVWKGHLSKPELMSLLNTYKAEYDSLKDDLSAVLSEAEREQARWRQIVDVYNDRFDVPFQVKIENQRDVILKHEAAKLSFSYIDGNNSLFEKKKDDLINILSKGEKRAFYVLQLLFELESRKESEHTSIIVMDDIADSFDYQNKYAIVEYIKDLAENNGDKFLIIVMTHNFDFYRTMASRLQSHRPVLLMATRDKIGIVQLNPGQYVNNVYSKVFIGHDNDNTIFISMIPYVRNLIEYTKGDEDADYLKLTSCLHIKSDTFNITEEDVLDIVKQYTHGKPVRRVPSSGKIIDTIMNTADSITEDANLNPVLIQNKITLSIAIRLHAEQYMHNKLIELGMTEEELSVSGTQTGKWTGMYKRALPNDEHISIIEKVNMMTPELIHVNSFMFEPIIDMSISHLISLYKQCRDELS